MSVHHYDSLRWLLGTPLQVFSTAVRDPRTTFDHSDGLVTSVIRFASGAIGQCLEDTWVGPTEWMTAADSSVRWRVTGERGVIEGTCGWPEWPNEAPSTARYLSDNTEGSWVQPHFKSAWFPDSVQRCDVGSATGTEARLRTRELRPRPPQHVGDGRSLLSVNERSAFGRHFGGVVTDHA